MRPQTDRLVRSIMAALFRDRTDAGRQLAARLGAYANQPDILVLGLPRGGVPVAFEVAQALNAPLDVCVVRKLGLPGQEELAMGAITSDSFECAFTPFVGKSAIQAP